MGRPAASPCDTLAEQYQTLLEITDLISTRRSVTELFHDLAQRLPRVVPVNFVALSLHDPERQVMRLHTLQANVPADLIGGHEEPLDETPTGLVWRQQQALILTDISEETRWPKVIGRMREDGIRSLCILPLTTALRRLGTIGFASIQPGAYDDTDVEFLRQVARQIAVTVDNVLHHQDLTRDRDRLRLLLEVSEAIAPGSQRALPRPGPTAASCRAVRLHQRRLARARARRHAVVFFGDVAAQHDQPGA
jgi:formate hydrogenlyase transcriptional activator